MRDLILIALIAFAAGWLTNGWRLEIDHVKDRANLLAESQEAIMAAQKKERVAHERISEIEKDAIDKRQALESAALAAAADNQRLQRAVGDLSRRYASDASVASDCKSAATAARVQAELLGGLSKLAEASARDSGAVRIALESCVAAFEAAKGAD